MGLPGNSVLMYRLDPAAWAPRSSHGDVTPERMSRRRIQECVVAVLVSPMYSQRLLPRYATGTPRVVGGRRCGSVHGPIACAWPANWDAGAYIHGSRSRVKTSIWGPRCWSSAVPMNHVRPTPLAANRLSN